MFDNLWYWLSKVVLEMVCEMVVVVVVKYSSKYNPLQ